MQNDDYVLDLLVTGAEYVSVIDDGTGTDTIRVTRVYTETVQIDLAFTIARGLPYSATSRFVSALNIDHKLVIFGVIENAFGGNGSEDIRGNDLANLLSGDQRPNGIGAADTLTGAAGADSLYGGSGNDRIHGGADNDALWGDAGNDYLSGGTGDDTLMGGFGADRLDGGGDAGDTLSYATSRRGISVQLSASATTEGRGGDAAGDRISGFAQVTGSAVADRILFLDKGDLPLGQGDNVVHGGGGLDRIALGGGHDLAYGGSGDDLIYGELGNDTLYGDSGRDQLFGGFGQDMLSGGLGADRFIFAVTEASRPDSPDVITDFSATDMDVIDLGLIDAVPDLAGDQAFTLVTGDFTGLAGELRVEVQGSDLIVQADTNGDAQADFVLLLQNCDGLNLADLIL